MPAYDGVKLKASSHETEISERLLFLLINYRTAYCINTKILGLKIFHILTMEAVNFYETSVSIYQSTALNKE
jgi:hypothetical protein